MHVVLNGVSIDWQLMDFYFSSSSISSSDFQNSW
jgi:hypothetical protein